jgi:uncharacterized membrane protein HdeD (DUF308 family)
MEAGVSDASPQIDEEAPWRLGWQAALLLGVVTLVLGLIVAFHPTTSLTVIMVLLGVLLLVAGAFHIVRAFAAGEEHRVWRVIAGLLCVVTGVVMIRHLQLSLAVIALFIGFTWIVQGLLALFEAMSGRRSGVVGWAVLFGAISVIAGIVVVSVPISSITALAVLTGIWFIVMGIMEIVGALVFRHEMRKAEEAGPVNVPGQRAASSAPDSAVPGSATGSSAAGRQASG